MTASLKPHANAYSNAGPVDLSVLLPPFTKIDLPTAGHYAGTPASVSVRGMTVRELKQLTTGKHLTGRAIDTIIRTCIKEPVDLSSMLQVDYNAIALNIRLATQSSETTGMHYCEHCGNKFKVTYDLSSVVRVSYASDDIPKTRLIKMERISERLGRLIEFEVKPLTRGDFLTLESALYEAKARASKTGEPMEAFPMAELLKAQIKWIHGLDSVPLPPQTIIDYLNEEDAEEVVAAFNEIGAAVTGSVECKCPICEELSNYEVPFTDLFFR